MRYYCIALLCAASFVACTHSQPAACTADDPSSCEDVDASALLQGRVRMTIPDHHAHSPEGAYASVPPGTSGSLTAQRREYDVVEDTIGSLQEKDSGMVDTISSLQEDEELDEGEETEEEEEENNDQHTEEGGGKRSGSNWGRRRRRRRRVPATTTTTTCGGFMYEVHSKSSPTTNKCLDDDNIQMILVDSATTYAVESNSKSGQYQLHRPSYMTTLSQSGPSAAWTPCAGTTNCFGGVGGVTTNEDPAIKGHLTGTQDSKIAVEILVNCADTGEIDVVVYCGLDGTSSQNYAAVNAKMDVWYNGVNQGVDIGNGAHAKCSKKCGGNKPADTDPETWGQCDGPKSSMYIKQASTDAGNYKGWRHKAVFTPSAGDKQPVLRIEMSKVDASQSATMWFQVRIRRFIMSSNQAKTTTNGEDISLLSFDKCMQTKKHHGQCLDKIPVSSQMRTDHDMQWQCLHSRRRKASTVCEAWKDCLGNSDGHRVLLNVLKGFKKSTALLIESVKQNNMGHQSSSRAEWTPPTCAEDAEHKECLDPETFDAEAFECRCYDDILNKTPSQIHNLACKNKKVCCDWKNAHCAPNLLQAHTSSLLRQRQNGTEVSLASTATSQDSAQSDEQASLDNTLRGKCA